MNELNEYGSRQPTRPLSPSLSLASHPTPRPATHQERPGDGLQREGLGVLDQAAQNAHGRGQNRSADGVRAGEAVERPEPLPQPALLPTAIAQGVAGPLQHAVGCGGRLQKGGWSVCGCVKGSQRQSLSLGVVAVGQGRARQKEKPIETAHHPSIQSQGKAYRHRAAAAVAATLAHDEDAGSSVPTLWWARRPRAAPALVLVLRDGRGRRTNAAAVGSSSASSRRPASRPCCPCLAAATAAAALMPPPLSLIDLAMLAAAAALLGWLT